MRTMRAEPSPTVSPEIIIQNPLEIPNTELRIVWYGDSIAAYQKHRWAWGRREDFDPMIDYLTGWVYEKSVLRLDSARLTPWDLTQRGYIPIGKNDWLVKIRGTDHLRELDGRLYRVMSVHGGKKALISNERDENWHLTNSIVQIDRLSDKKSALYIWSDSFQIGSRPAYNAKFPDGTFGLVHAVGKHKELDIILKNGPKEIEKILWVARIPWAELPNVLEVLVWDDTRLPKAIVQIQRSTLEFIRHIADIR